MRSCRASCAQLALNDAYRDTVIIDRRSSCQGYGGAGRKHQELFQIDSSFCSPRECCLDQHPAIAPPTHGLACRLFDTRNLRLPFPEAFRADASYLTGFHGMTHAVSVTHVICVCQPQRRTLLMTPSLTGIHDITHAGLVDWLQQKGIELGSSSRMEEAFADGILLCHLVQNRWHSQLAGITWAHPSPAAARHNVTQVLPQTMAPLPQRCSAKSRQKVKFCTCA